MRLNAEQAYASTSSEEQLGRHNGSGRGAPPVEPWIGVDDLAMVLGVSTDWVLRESDVR